MSFRYKTILLLTVFAFVGFSVSQGFAETSDYGAKGALSQSDMDLKGMLTYAIEDAYLAKADYELIMDRYGRIWPFSNIAMYEAFLERELPADVRDVFEQLKQASENHLRAIKNNLRKYS